MPASDKAASRARIPDQVRFALAIGAPVIRVKESSGCTSMAATGGLPASHRSTSRMLARRACACLDMPLPVRSR